MKEWDCSNRCLFVLPLVFFWFCLLRKQPYVLSSNVYCQVPPPLWEWPVVGMYDLWYFVRLLQKMCQEKHVSSFWHKQIMTEDGEILFGLSQLAIREAVDVFFVKPVSSLWNLLLYSFIIHFLSFSLSFSLYVWLCVCICKLIWLHLDIQKLFYALDQR